MIVNLIYISVCVLSSALCTITDIKYSSTFSLPEDTGSHRWKRQSECGVNEWKCNEGTCILTDVKCDGVVDCPDGSDEMHAVCWKTPCPKKSFRCTYGACVDGSAPCNALSECADNSDELLPRCKNETRIINGQFKCLDGSLISGSNLCDGFPDCEDGSDETIRACAGFDCWSKMFQCAYGACVASNANCNQIKECADNSDEADELCGTNTTVIIKPTPGKCELPSHPDNGFYTTNIEGSVEPGMSYKYVTINVTCYRKYGIDVGGQRSKSVSCQDGIWQDSIPKCSRQCRLPTHPSVEYICIVSGDITGTRPCKTYEPKGTLVRPVCRAPDYYAPNTLTEMECEDGYWNYIAKCKPECGKVPHDGVELIVDGVRTRKGHIPWHAGIYSKSYTPFKQICGGTLINNQIIISAAHCFWDDVAKQLPASRFAVAVGKLYRPWHDKMDESQESDVKQINIPLRFRGADGHFQDDIALVIVVDPFELNSFIRPVCLNFDADFERRQLQTPNKGRVAGWGLTSANGKPSSFLQSIDLPYVEVGTCTANYPKEYRVLITSDKICAGTLEPNSAVCKGDSGGGLAFSSYENEVLRFYLRGIVSTAPRVDDLCNVATYTTFTRILSHEHYIKRYFKVF